MLLCTYVLFCPVTGEIRYVGKSDRHLERRVKGHISEARHKKLGERGEWLRWLIAQGLEPIIEHDVDVPDGVPWQQVERERVAYYRSIGCNLVNGTDGGEGLHRPTEAVRRRMAASATGRKASVVTRERMSITRTGKKHSPEWIANISAGHKGKTQAPHTDEQRAKISAGLKRYYETNEAPPISPEQREKISAGLKRYFASVVKPVVEKPEKPGRGKWIRTVPIPKSPEHKAKIAAALLGRKHSPERRAAISAGHTGKLRGPRPPEVRAKISAGHRKRRPMRLVFDCHIASQTPKPSDRIIQNEPLLRFKLDYPFDIPIAFDCPHDDGSPWTERQFVDAIHLAYQAAYESVGSDSHVLDDLYLEGAERNSDGSWTLDIGS